MSALPKPHYITEEEYFAGEERSVVKHEWLDGVVYAMAGGSFNHALLCHTTSGAARNALRGKTCRSLGSEIKIKIESNGQIVYPDAVIFCPPSRFVGKGDSALVTPKVIFEVLSPTTRDYDKAGKFALYKTIPTFEEYVLIEPDQIWVDHYRHTENGWIHQSFNRRQDVLKLESAGIEMTLDEIYDELELPEGLFAFAPSSQNGGVDE